MADPRWRMEFSKMTVESVQNAHPRVFRVADYELLSYLQNSLWQIQDGGFHRTLRSGPS